MRVRLLSLVALTGLLLAGCGVGTQETGGPVEGIQVHGDWVIDIHNPDGSLDFHHEFSNDLTTAGIDALVAILGDGDRTQCSDGDFECAQPDSKVDWFIQLDHHLVPGPEEPPCENVSGQAVPCTIFDTEVDTGTAGHILISGSVTAANDGLVNEVSTILPLANAGAQLFTLTDVVDPETGQAIVVAADQVIEVQVDISFTSG